jgi:retron-type reverse transcriptase
MNARAAAGGDTGTAACWWRPPEATGKPRRLADLAQAGEGPPGIYGVAAMDDRRHRGLSHAGPYLFLKTGRSDYMKEQHRPSLLERIYSWENLLDAYHEAAKEKWYRDDVAAFSANLEANLISIQNDLMWRTYEVGRYREFYVHEPKKRLIMALGFRDRVVQWAIYLQVNQELDNGMIYHSYGCRVGKGTTRAAERLQYWSTLVDRKPERWHYLKLDVSKYFYRVDHEVLLGILARKYPGEDGFLWLMRRIVCCDHTPFGLPPGVSADEVPPSERLFEVGMPIGNLTSQPLANVCLNELDQYIKHELRAHFYVRYMDDMVLLHPDAKVLNEWRVLIESYLNEVLHLELNGKTTIGLVKRGITFVGCRIYPGYRKPTKAAVKKMKARMRYIAKEYEEGLIDFDVVDATMQSYFGLLGHCATHGLQKWIEKNIIFKRKDGEPSQEVTTWTTFSQH